MKFSSSFFLNHHNKNHQQPPPPPRATASPTSPTRRARPTLRQRPLQPRLPRSPPASEEDGFCSESEPSRCAAAGRTVCLVFDPWQRGQADVHEFGDWSRDIYAGRIPADFFLHELPEPRPAPVPKAKR